jgi:signal transduction histidine kinase
VTLSVEAPDDLPLVEVDPVRIAQVVSNLLANALRHSPAGSTVSLQAWLDESDRSVVFAVCDRGPGFPPELLPHAFDRFARGPDSPGAGLGLAIARDLVAAHGGRIEARDRAEGGAEVIVHLPIRADAGRLAGS